MAAQDQTERDQLACTYAALILQDDSLEVTPENIAAIVKAANITVNPYFPRLWARVLKGRNVGDLISNAGGAPSAGPVSSGAAAPAAAGAAAPAAGAAKEAPKKEEKKEEEEEDAGGAGMGGLFGDEEEY